MQATSPALVREEQIARADDPDRTVDCVFSHPVNRTSLNGVTGYPSRATKEEGETLFSWMVEDLSALIDKGMQELPPLNHSYFEPINTTTESLQ
jgi:creatinine amidohydrolase